MTLTDTKHRTSSSVDRIVLNAENEALQREVDRLKRKTRQLESQEMLREAETAADFTAGQMDRTVYNVRNANYGMDKLVSAIDGIRRYDALLSKTQGVQVNPHREAVTVVYLCMNHYQHKRDNISKTSALRELTELTGRINKYFEMRCRPADCFAKGGWQDHMFMFVLPATDRAGAKTFLDRVVRVAIKGHEGAVDISYGIANHAADVQELHPREESRAIASRLLDAAKKIARDQNSEFAGRIEKEAQYQHDAA
ncbi:hypothetical protein KY310_00950 [Candidatus Woesearchaeota archaeon]|nr:hypothetical protein [Candidatus Woesearchaeota archaeon]